MNLTEYLEKFGRTLFESPLARTAPLESPPELAEIRFAVLDQVKRNSYRAGGRQVFPYDLVHVSMRGVEESRAPAFRSAFFRQYLEQEIQGSLRADHVRFPEQLRVDVDIATGLPMPNEPWLMVAVGSREQAGALNKSARLVVSQGRSNTPELSLDKPRVHIGREVDVYRNGGMHRRNDLAFVTCQHSSVASVAASIAFPTAAKRCPHPHYTAEQRLLFLHSRDPFLPPPPPWRHSLPRPSRRISSPN